MKPWLSWLAPVLLCLVAGSQIWVTAHWPLSSWKLGGFGMYASVDSVAARWIRPVVVLATGELPVPWELLERDRPDLEAAARQVRSWPDAGRLAALGDDLLHPADREWADCTPARLRRGGRVSGLFVRLIPADLIRSGGCRRLAVQGLRLEVWRYDYAPSERRLRGRELVEAEVRR